MDVSAETDKRGRRARYIGERKKKSASPGGRVLPALARDTRLSLVVIRERIRERN